MRRLTVFLVALAISLPTSYLHARKKPVTVIITAGQSNTDGRVSNDDLPSYIKENGYSYCKWSYGSDTLSGGGRFTPFWPRVFKQDNTNKWGYDAIVYYLIEKSPIAPVTTGCTGVLTKVSWLQHLPPTKAGSHY